MKIKSTVQMYTEGFEQNAAVVVLSLREVAVVHPQGCSVTGLLPWEASPFGCGWKTAHPDHPEKQSPHANLSLSCYQCLSRGPAQPAGATALVWKGFLVVRSSLVIRVSPPRMRNTPPHQRTSWHSPYNTKPRKACGTQTAVWPGGHMPPGCNHSGWAPPDSPGADCPPRAGRKVWSWKSWA